MIDDPLYQQNLIKIKELLPEIQLPTQQWMQDCFDSGFPFRIAEGFRSQARQNELYKIGRRGIKGEEPVTWTKSSKHTKRLAIDVYPTQKMSESNQRVFLSEIEAIGRKYGILRPAETLKLGDFVHWELDGAHLLMIPEEHPKEKAIKELRKLSGNPRQRGIDRFVKIYGEVPQLE